MKLIDSIKTNLSRILGITLSEDVQTEAELDQLLADLKPVTDTNSQLTALQASILKLETKATETETLVSAALSDLETQVKEHKAQLETANATIISLTNELSTAKSGISELAKNQLKQISMKQGGVEVEGFLEDASENKPNPNRATHKVEDN